MKTLYLVIAFSRLPDGSIQARRPLLEYLSVLTDLAKMGTLKTLFGLGPAELPTTPAGAERAAIRGDLRVGLTLLLLEGEASTISVDFTERGGVECSDAVASSSPEIPILLRLCISSTTLPAGEMRVTRVYEPA